MNIQKWMEKNCSDLSGKTVCITGSTGGIAIELVYHLASLGANFIFANRDKEKSLKQKQDLLALFPNIKVEILLVDMSNLNSVKMFVCKLKQLHVDILILNSAVYNVPRKTTPDGFDNVFQINFVSPYYIAKQMISSLKKIKDSKVVVISSIAHNYSKFNLSDPQKLKSKKSSIIYGNSKRLFMFSIQKLFADSGVNIAVTHPGVTLTKMTSHYPKVINWLVKLGIKFLFPNPNKASLPILYGVFNNTHQNEWIGPSKFNIWGYPKKQNLKTCSNNEQEQIFELAESIYHKISN